MILKQRLLHEITPKEYDIVLKPNLETFTFTGEETLSFTVFKPTKKFSLHAKNLTIENAVLLMAGEEYVADISYDKKDMMATLQFAHALKIGDYTVQLTFSGVIGEQLKGWYKSAYTVNGETNYMATSQLEEIGAREIFPSIDDPSAKAVFAISFIIPSHLTAISNTIDTHVKEHENGFKTVSFAPTPKMATYALAFIVGEFESIETTTKNGTKIRVFVTPGKKSQAQFALDVTAKMLPFYEEYFDIPYPLPVMDLIAIPDFDAGAMENWGAITAREVALLVDDTQTSAANKQWVATVIAHEITHMWFGDLVTMKWWDDLWLNEGFASYMEYKGVDYLFPQWKVWEQFAVLDHNRAMRLDSLENTHPIQTTVKDVEKISENFDEVSYSKGASIIQMIAEYLGEKGFRKGLQYYLKKYAYANAKTKDLWNALEKVTGKKVGKIMRSFTEKPGYPVITVSLDSSLHLKQSRFYSNAISSKKSKDITVWTIPLTNKTEKGEDLLIFDTKTMQIAQPESWIKINSGETSFVRTIYAKDLYEKLSQPIQDKILSSVDRMGIIRDAFDSAESGFLPTTLALGLAKSYTNEISYIVWAALCGKLGKVENLLTSKTDEKNFQEYARNILKVIGSKVGWEKKPGETHEDILLRSTILATLGLYKDQEVISKAKELFVKVLQDKKSVDTDIRGVVYALVGENGGEKEFAELRDLYTTEELSAEKNRIGNAMCLFADPKLTKKALEFSLSEHVRTQDIGRFLVMSFSNKKGREVAWEFVKAHWELLLSKLEGIEMDWIIDGTADVTDAVLAKDIFAFFKSHPHPKLEKAMRQVREQIESNVEWQKRDGQAIEKFLQNEV